MTNDRTDIAAHRAFEAYAAAKRKADETLDFDDARAAGRAWCAFLNVFVDPQHHIIDHAVVQFPKKAQRS